MLSTATPQELLKADLDALERYVHTARKNSFRLSSHTHYRGKSRECLASLRKQALLLKKATSSSASAQLAGLVTMIENKLSALHLEADPPRVTRSYRGNKIRSKY